MTRHEIAKNEVVGVCVCERCRWTEGFDFCRRLIVSSVATRGGVMGLSEGSSNLEGRGSLEWLKMRRCQIG